MTTPNAELAYRVLDHIDAHPEQWNQRTWFQRSECGTAACFAGWTVVLAGHQVEVDDTPNENKIQLYTGIDGDFERSLQVVAIEDLGIRDAEVACQSCEDCGGLDWAADALFDWSNTREDLGRLVGEIFGPRPEHCGYRYDHPAHSWTRLANDEQPDDQDARCSGGAS